MSVHESSVYLIIRIIINNFMFNLVMFASVLVSKVVIGVMADEFM